MITIYISGSYGVHMNQRREYRNDKGSPVLNKIPWIMIKELPTSLKNDNQSHLGKIQLKAIHRQFKFNAPRTKKTSPGKKVKGKHKTTKSKLASACYALHE